MNCKCGGSLIIAEGYYQGDTGVKHQGYRIECWKCQRCTLWEGSEERAKESYLSLGFQYKFDPTH